MKVTQYKTNGKAVKNLPLDELMDQMRREQKQFPVRAFREELYYRFRDTKCRFAEKLPVIVFSSTFRRVKKQVVMKNYNERYWFTPEEEAEITGQNSAFQQLPPAEQLFLRYFRAAEPGEENVERLSAVEILERIRKRCSVQLPPTTLTTFGRLLQKNKVSRVHTAKGNLYLVAEVM